MTLILSICARLQIFLWGSTGPKIRRGSSNSRIFYKGQGRMERSCEKQAWILEHLLAF
jgi:hypothetical protein